MSDLISRQDAIDAILGITPIQNTIPLDSAIFNIKKLPSAQKKGEWNSIGWHSNGTAIWLTYKCSNCGDRYTLQTPYCPSCGADMKGNNNE